jgi:predicted DNA-binding transcriptional regulator AlpA
MSHAHLLKFPKDVNPQGFVSPKQVADLLKVSVKTIYHRISKGETFGGVYRPFEGSRSIRFIAKDVLRWIDVNTRTI